LTLKNQKQTNEIAFYMTNQDCQIDDIAKEYCQAIRKHWSVEVNNHKRDVSLKEDKFKSREKNTAKTAAIIRSLVLNIVKKTKCRNIVAQLEKFQDDFNELLRWLRQIKFL
jgi:predicted transposase YbfD/YdcC